MGGLMVMEGSYREARFGSRGMAEYARGDVDGHCATDEASAAAVAAAQREARALTSEERSLVATAKRSALRFPDTQQQLVNAHAALAAGVAGAIPLLVRFCCRPSLPTHTVHPLALLSSRQLGMLGRFRTANRFVLCFFRLDFQHSTLFVLVVTLVQVHDGSLRITVWATF